MQPVFEYVVCVRAAVSADAIAHFLHVRASNACVIMSARIPANGLFASMSEGAHSPVVNKTFGARNDLYGARERRKKVRSRAKRIACWIK